MLKDIRCRLLRLASIVLASAAAVTLPGSAASYQLNPLKDRSRGGDLPPWWLKAPGSIHEDLTHAAIACAERFPQDQATRASLLCPPTLRDRRRGDPGNIHNPLIVGLWWNDDPNHFAFANLLVPAAFQYVEMKEVAKRVRQSRGQAKDPRTGRMLYRSHYGDLQFLHAMASADLESPYVTQQKIIDWMNFAYKVATSQISPDAKLGKLDQAIQSLFPKHGEMTVSRLFRPRRSMAHIAVPELALGSMLHVVQDSFPAAHTRRIYVPSANCPRGRISQFYSFLHQASHRHLAEDNQEALRKSSATAFTLVQNPVDASARLILLTRARADWATVVEPYLRGTLFCVDEDASAAGPGPVTL